MKAGIVILVVLLILALVVGGAYVSRRNQMAIKREAVNAAWAQVDVVLQRRADLIPNLVETVKGYAVQEQTVFGDIAAARAALIGAKTPEDTFRQDRRERAIGLRVGPLAGDRGELSATEIQREFHALAG